MRNIPNKAWGAALSVIVAILVAFGVVANPPADSGSPSSSAASVASSQPDRSSGATYTFRSNAKLKEHYEKHGVEMGFASAEEYLAAANAVIANPDALHKLEAEDGDDVYYLVDTDEIVFLSTDGYIRTYFNPGGIGYFNRQ